MSQSVSSSEKLNSRIILLRNILLRFILLRTIVSRNNSTESVEETSPEPKENKARDYSMYGSCLDQAKAMRRQGTKSQYSIIAYM